MAEVMQIHCPTCSVRLAVPQDAGGRMARCPKCKTKFPIPDPRQMLDDTITCWLNLDQMDDDDMHDSIAGEIEMQRTAMGMAPPTETKPKEKPKPKRKSSKARKSAPELKDAPRRVLRRRRSGDEAPAETSAPQANGGAAQPEAPAEGEAVDTAHRAVASQAGDPSRLSLISVTSAGVRFGFAVGMLNTIAFRASMPMCDVYTTEHDPGNMIARPLAWVDKATGKFTNPGEIEARYEHHVKLHQSTREVVEAMRAMDELPSPYNLPMPYYVTRGSGKAPLHCETYQSPQGVQCEVTIPNSRVALDWLGRVNGVCCDEYSQLEKEANKLEASTWQSFPDKVRKRLSVWFDFEQDEDFLAYFNEGDFSSSDLGLAGLIVTDARLVYCKYHSMGSIRHNKPATIVAVESGRFATLIRVDEKQQKRIVKLRSEDLDELVTLLDEVNSEIELLSQEADASS